MTTPPTRIYNWLDSQLSIARFAGSITINGVTYVIAMHEEGQPLVRQDVLVAEAKTKKEGEKRMNTQAIDTAKSLQRIQKYLDRLAIAKGYPKECIHTFIDKDGDEIPLLVADLKALLQQVTTTSTNTDAKDAARYRWLRDNDWNADKELGPVIRLQLNAIWDVKIDAAMAEAKAKEKGEKK